MRTDDKRGFSLSELTAAIVVGGIVVLTIAAIGSVVFQSYNGLRNQSGVYNDAQYALQLIAESVRQSTVTPVADNALQGSLTLATAACTNISFRVQTVGTPTCPGTSLVYDHNCGATNITADPIICNVPNLVFTPDLSASPLVSITLSGTKNGVTFNFSNTNAAVVDGRMKVLERNL